MNIGPVFLVVFVVLFGVGVITGWQVIGTILGWAVAAGLIVLFVAGLFGGGE